MALKGGHDPFFSEREYGAFQRIFRSIEAGFRNGVLSIRIPKARAETGPLRNTEIKSHEN